MSAKFDSNLMQWKRVIEARHSYQQETHNGEIQQSEVPASASSDNGSKLEDSLSGSSDDLQSSSATSNQKIFQITGDNVDFEVRTKYMTLDRRNKSLQLMKE